MKKRSVADHRGYVRLWRRLRDNPIYSNSKAVHCWLECLMRASHKGKTFYLKRQKIYLKPGQFCTGREDFAKSVDMSGSTAWRWINIFESEGMIEIKSSNKGTVITVKNWGKYQNDRKKHGKLGENLIVDKKPDSKPDNRWTAHSTEGKVKTKTEKGKPDSKPDNRWTTDEQRMNTNNNDNNVKNVKNNIYTFYKKHINSKSRLTRQARAKIKTRLKTFSLKELKQAIRNFSNNDWWMENNAHRGLTWFFYSDDRVDQFINLKSDKKPLEEGHKEAIKMGVTTLKDLKKEGYDVSQYKKIGSVE